MRLNVIDSTVWFNYAHGNGGAIWTDSDEVNITGSTITDNATFGANAGSGGGVYYQGLQGLIANSLIRDNSAEEGGGVMLADGDMTINDNTVITVTTRASAMVSA